MSGMPSRKSARSEPVPATGRPPASLLRGRAGEGKRAARILLREDVELLPPDVSTELNAVVAAVPQAVVGKRLRLVGVSRVFGFGKPRHAAGEDQVRRTPVRPASGRCPKCRLRRTRWCDSRSTASRPLPGG